MKQLNRLERGERIKISPLVLRRRRRAEALPELVVPGGIPSVGQDRDERWEHVRIHSECALLIPLIEFGSTGLDVPVIPDGPQGAEEIASKLPGQFLLPGGRDPPELSHSGATAIAHESLKRGPIGWRHDSVQEME